MQELININDALMTPNTIFIDVRSESEFAEDHLPDAINIPLFNDAERAEVGTVYKGDGVEKAKILGLKLSAPKLPSIYDAITAYKGRNIVLYCWRGGMRSKTVQTILNLLGLKTLRLEGGYKAYRRFINTYFEKPLSLDVVILHGLTGVGKTELINMMANHGVNTIDLEGLAHNRGSVYGNVALPPQPSQKLFESMIFRELWLLNNQKYVIMECESKRIGKVSLPNTLFKAMQEGKHILIYDSIPSRTQRIITEYTKFHKDEAVLQQLLASTQLLQKRLGKIKTENLLDLINKKDYVPVVKDLLINYYDPLYNYPDHPSAEYDFSVDAGDQVSAVKQIEEFLKNEYLLGGVGIE